MMKKLPSTLIALAFFTLTFIAVIPIARAATPVVLCADGTQAPSDVNGIPDINLCPTKPESTTSGPCSKGSFLGFPKWYKYLEIESSTDAVTGNLVCQPKLTGLSGIWRIVAAVIEIMLRIAGLVAIGFVVYGGFSYTISQGAPDKTKQALKTIISALVGLVITIIATALVTFIAGRF